MSNKILYTDIIKNSLVEKYDDFNQLEESMSNKIIEIFGTPKEKDEGKLEPTMLAGINSVINKLKDGYQIGDEIWLWVDNPNFPFGETWGYAVIRDGEPTKWEILGRR